MPRELPAKPRGAFTLSTREQIIAGRLGGEKAWNTLTPEQQEAYIKEQQQIEKRNRDWAIQAGLPNNSEKGTQGLVSQGTMADFPEPIKTRAGQFATGLQKKFPQFEVVKLQERILEKYKEYGEKKEGKEGEERLLKAKQAVETNITSASSPTMSGGRRRNRTKHRRSKNKRTRRFRRR